MSRTRKERKRAATIAEIKQVARQLMAEHGTAGLSIRAIGRAMGMTSAAIYYYFDSLDDLITALVVDAFEDLAHTLEHAATADAPARERLVRLVDAYRHWALQRPTDFQLIYGNPIPGYEQPTGVTYPPARRSFAALAGVLQDAINAGELVPPPVYSQPPDAFAAPFQALQQIAGHTHSPAALYLAASIWAQIYGRVMLELFHLIQPVLGDAAAFYRHETRAMLQHIGFDQTHR